MRRTIFGFSGRALYWLGWPALFMYLLGSERTRIVISCGDKILVVKGWLSDGGWSLPGGGIHKGEEPVQALIREVREETSIVLAGGAIHFVGRYHHTKGMRYDFHLFDAELTDMPVPVCQPSEIADAQWLPWKDLLVSNKLNSDAKQAVEAWVVQK